jgi:thiamine biosynthesis lipoprotein
VNRVFPLIFLILLSCTRTEQLKEFDGFLFGSYLKVKVLESNQEKANRVVAKAFAEMIRLDSLFSLYKPGSEINQINRQGKGKLSKDLKDLLVRAIEVSEKSNGAFDITVYPLIQFWRTYFKMEKIPDSFEIKHRLKFVDYRKVKIQNDSVYLPDSFKIDLGGIAVGYSIDRAVEILKREGIKIGIIDAGGDIMGFGNRKWKIGVKNPRGDGLMRFFSISNQGIATSGDYEKFFLKDGKRYHHIINPKTGYPAWGCCSVTVIAPNAITADAYSTTLFVLGVKDGLALAEKVDGVEAFIITEENENLKKYQSSGIK